MPDVIQSLWIGPRLSSMERLCISSFLQNGHPFHLYVYQETEGVPRGTVVLDGNSILPSSRIFTYREHRTYAGFANFFRYKLLLEKGGWFVDADTVCLRPFQFRAPYVFSSEGIHGEWIANAAAIKVPPGSPVMQFAWDTCQSLNTSELKWGQCGPDLMTQAVEHCSLKRFVHAPDVFCPVHYTAWEDVLKPATHWRFDRNTCSVHLWNEMWRRAAKDKDADWDPQCLYEQLKRRYREPPRQL